MSEITLVTLVLIAILPFCHFAIKRTVDIFQYRIHHYLPRGCRYVLNLKKGPYGLALDVVNNKVYISDVDEWIVYTDMLLSAAVTPAYTTNVIGLNPRQIAYGALTK